MSYSENGIYTCLIKKSDFVDNSDKFVITDSKGNLIYGTPVGCKDCEVSAYHPYQFSMFYNKKAIFLSNNNSDSFKINCSEDNMLVRIDMRAGINSPVIVLLPANKISGSNSVYTYSACSSFVTLRFEVNESLIKN